MTVDESVVQESPELGQDWMVRGWLLTKGLSDAGDALWTVALAWTAVQVTSPALAGVVVAAGSVPRAIMLLVGGVVADRRDARRVMLAVNLVRSLVLGATAIWVVVEGASASLLVLAAVGFGVCDAIYEPSAGTIARQLVRPEQMPAYASANQVVSRLSAMAGAAAGGALVAGWGLGGGAVVNAISFLAVVGYLVFKLRPRYPLLRAPAEPMLMGIARGFSHLKHEPTTRSLVLTLSGLNLAVSPALALGVTLRAQDEGWGAQIVGLLHSVVGVGALLGALLLTFRRPRREVVTGLLLLMLQGLAIAGLGLGSVPSTALSCALIGMTAGAASALLGAVFVGTVRGEYLGRMVAITRLGDDVLMPVAMVAFGSLAASAGVDTACAVFGLLMCLAMLGPLSKPGVRKLSLSRC